MVQPQTEGQTNKFQSIYPEIKLAVAYLISKYDQVMKELKKSKKRKYRQFYNNLEAVNGDGKTFRKLASRFNFSEDQIKEFYELTLKDYID